MNDNELPATSEERSREEMSVGSDEPTVTEGMSETAEAGGGRMSSDSDAPEQMDIEQLKDRLRELGGRLQTVSLRTWLIGGGLVIVLLFFATRCGGGGASEYLVVADERGNIYALPSGDLPPSDLDVDSRIGRTLDLPEGGEAIQLWVETPSGASALEAEVPILLTASGDRIALLDDRRAGLRLERGSVGGELGDGEELASGEFSEIAYYAHKDVLYYELRIAGGNVSCHVARSGGEPERIGTGDSCRLWPEAELVAVRGPRDIKLYDYKGEEALELDLRNFDDVDVFSLDGGSLFLVSFVAGDGSAELVLVTPDGDQMSVASADTVGVAAVSELTDAFLYSVRDSGEDERLFLWSSGAADLVNSGDVVSASISPDGSAAVAEVVDDSGQYQVWFADLADDGGLELVYDAHSGDVGESSVQWSTSADSELLLVIDGRDERDSIAELRSASREATLEQPQSVWDLFAVPVGDMTVSFSGGSDDRGAYQVVELVRDGEIEDSAVIDGSIESVLIVNDQTLAVSLGRDGASYLNLLSTKDREIELTEVLAADRIGSAAAVDGSIYAASRAVSGFEEVVTAKPGDTQAEHFDDEITGIVSVLSSDPGSLSTWFWG